MDKETLIIKAKRLKAENDVLREVIQTAIDDLGDQECSASIRGLSARLCLETTDKLVRAYLAKRYGEEKRPKMTRTENLKLENRILKESLESAREVLRGSGGHPTNVSVNAALQCLDYEEKLKEEIAKEVCVWILTFQDGYMRSVHGTEAQAVMAAEKLADRHGKYKIT